MGREGPIVQIGSGFGSAIGQLFSLSHVRIKTLVACGASAGIAATFNAPIAGVLFSIEIILGNFTLHTFSPLVVSAIIATMISRFYLGNIPVFVVPHYLFRSPWELPLYIILGAVIGGIALLFIFSVGRTETLFNKWNASTLIKSPAGMACIGIMICFFPYIYGNGYETITMTLSDQLGIWLLLALIPIKILATSLTFGCGGSGGVFSPALFIGAVSGACFGKFVHILFPSITATSGAYAMVGMGAMISASVHAPFTAIITLFELTGDYTIMLPLMSACVISSLVSSTFKKESVYIDKLKRDGVDLNVGLESTIMKRNIVRDIMRVNVPVLDPDMPFDKLITNVLNSSELQYYVVGVDKIYLGELNLLEITRLLPNRKAAAPNAGRMMS